MIRKISHYGISSIYNSILGILSIFILTKFYTINDFGKVAMFILIGNVLGNVLTFGLGSATIRFYFESLKKNNFENFRKLNYSNFLILLILFIIPFIIIYNLQDFFVDLIKFEITANFLLIAYIYGILNTIYLYFLNLIIAQKKSKNFLFFSISYSTLNIFLTIFLIFFYKENYISRIYSLVIVNFVFSLIILIYLFDTLKLKFSLKSVIKSLKFSLPGYPSTLMGIAHNNFDKSFLALVKDIGALGILDISNKIGLMSKMFIDFIIQAWIPEFMTNANNNKKDLIVLNYNQIIYYFTIFILSLSFFSEEIIILLTSKEFYVAKYYIPLICLSVFINHSFTLISKPSITYAKKLQKLIIPDVLSLSVNIFLNIILIPKYGVLGVIFSLIFSGLVSGILTFLASQKVYQLGIPFKQIIIKIIIVIVYISALYLLFILNAGLILNFLLKILLISSFCLFFFKKEYFNKKYLNIKILKI